MFVDHDEYDQFVKELDFLLDEVGEDESHPLVSRLDVLSRLVKNYENGHVPELAIEGRREDN